MKFLSRLAWLVAFFVIGVLWWSRMSAPTPPPAPAVPLSEADVPPPPVPVSTPIPEEKPAPSAPVAPAALTTPPADALKTEPPSTDPQVALEAVTTLIRDFRLRFGENPVGTNPEITAALGGKNAKAVNFLSGTPVSVNEKGELLDTWGTPLFFHQESGKDMEVRSAGPDRRLWTEDDVSRR